MAGSPRPQADRLLEVIHLQTEIARLGSDLGAVMALVSQRVLDIVHAIGAVIELSEGDQMVYRAASGIAEPQLGLHLARAGSLSGLCILYHQPLRCDDSETDPRVNRDACREIGLRSMIVVPLRHNEEIVGVLKVMAAEPAAFDDEDVDTLGLMSGMIAAAMYHATQHESGALFHRATHDMLTGLPNRALFFERLRDQLVLAEREQTGFALLILDMDGLKPINDSLGHRAGDAAIREVGARIRATLRSCDTVARLGGDEFGVLIPRIADPEGVQRLANRVTSQLAADFVFEHKPLALGASVGMAIYPDDGESPETLLEAADKAMYASKRVRRM